MSAPSSTPIGFNHSLWNKPITRIPAHNSCVTAPTIPRAAAASSARPLQQSAVPHPSDCYARGGLQRPSMSTIPTPNSSAPNSAHHTPTRSLSLSTAALSLSSAASSSHGLIPPPPPPARLQQQPASTAAVSLSPAAATAAATDGSSQSQPAAARTERSRVVKRAVQLAGWTVERQPYVAMEAREVTVWQQRSIPAVEYSAHTDWRAADRVRLQPVPARREEPSRTDEQKEQLTLPCTAEPDQQQQQQVADSDSGAESGVLIAELGLRVLEVHGRHGSSGGLLVCAVRECSAGSRAAVLAGDVLMAVNSGEVRSVQQLRARVEGSVGPLLLRVMRHGRRHLTLIANMQQSP